MIGNYNKMNKRREKVISREYKRKAFCLIFLFVFLGIGIFALVRSIAEKQALDKVIRQRAILIDKNVSEYNILINSDIEKLEMTISAENLCEKGIKEIGIYQQSDWFQLDENQEYLCMYGGFNYAKWTFVNSLGEKTIIDMNDILYNDMFDTTLNNESKCVVVIPEGSIGAKVTYYKSEKGCIKYLKNVVYNFINGNFSEAKDEILQIHNYYKELKNQELFITYGMVPSGYVKNCADNFEVEKVTNGTSIIYDKEFGWKISDGSEKNKQIDSSIKLYAGCSIIYDKDVSIELVYSQNDIINENGIFGVKYSLKNNDIVCERIDDSVGLHSNYMYGEQYALPYENDFDNIYPWSEMKLCYLDNEGNVYYNYDEYQGNQKLNAMVEIPVFYVSRTVDNEEEYIRISKEYHDGFEIDPAFVTENGVCDKIYVSKYLASIYDDSIGSYDEMVPAIDISLETIDDINSEKGSNWQELDLLTLNMVQRLWLVETAVKNTQSVFKGYTESTFIWSSDDDPKYAVVSGSNSNMITIKKNDYTSKIEVGDNVIVITYTKENQYSAYTYFTENYVNDDDKWQRKVISIDDKGEYLDIHFSGESIDVISGETIIANLPETCGTTDNIDYHTGEETGKSGKNSFKYRNLENIWGNVCTILDGVSVEEDKVVVEYPNGEKIALSYLLPEQSKGGGVAKSFECAVKKMCLEKDDEFVMLPEIIGEGATLTNNYGDWLSIPETDVYTVENQVKYITYGMTWDLASYAGLFAYRVHPTYSSARVENGARIIYRK